MDPPVRFHLNWWRVIPHPDLHHGDLAIIFLLPWGHSQGLGSVIIRQMKPQPSWKAVSRFRYPLPSGKEWSGNPAKLFPHQAAKHDVHVSAFQQPHLEEKHPKTQDVPIFLPVARFLSEKVGCNKPKLARTAKRNPNKRADRAGNLSLVKQIRTSFASEGSPHKTQA